MCEIGEHVSTARSAFDEKFDNLTLPEQKAESGKRKRKSEPVFPEKESATTKKGK